VGDVPCPPRADPKAAYTSGGWRCILRAMIVVFLLCGGAGTRLRPVTDRPKSVIGVAGWPFLRFQIELVRSIAGRIVFLAGYRAEEIESTFGPPSDSRIFVREPEPLGTGGALAHARSFAGDTNWVANGDSFVDLDPEAFLKAHRSGEGTIAAVRVPDAGDYGSLAVADDGRISGYREKGISGPGSINAGVYLLDHALLSDLPEGPSSLERAAFPRWAREGRLRVHQVDAFFRDIGTPERLDAAQTEFVSIRARLERAR
jgi:D-glycero-alpha-D-manno-heptose 1-phosphate guanylyltransferase